ncbi:hypothetical protein D9758_015876 [Tetrapyrgos nigripes]|uniref:Uncharacterized protein n=1 Tax=Tetrapyrgos nigripes TaxID=182062 RepID=A0A8H5CJ38_9AGAR|nr:hypothetical protein D9758_015876 [Tetrapyrgos nigripes]
MKAMMTFYSKYINHRHNAGRVRPVLDASSTRTVAVHAKSWFLTTLVIFLWPVSFVFALAYIQLSSSWVALGLLELYVYYVVLSFLWVHLLCPELLSLSRLFVQLSFRYHRSHISQMRLDRYARLMKTFPDLITIFVTGIAQTSIPLLISKNASISDIKELLLENTDLSLDSCFWESDVGYLTLPGSFNVLSDDRCLSSFGLGSLSHVQFRARFLGGASSSSQSKGRRPQRDRKTEFMDNILAAEAEEVSGDDKPPARRKKKSTTRRRTTKPRQKPHTTSPTPCFRLPSTVPLASTDSKIAECINDDEAETPWARFNRFFDRVFGDDTRDGNGRMKHLTRGEFGMDTVTSYLVKLSTEGFPEHPLDLVHLRLLRLYDELVVLCPVSNDGDTDLENGDKSYKPPRQSPEVSDDSVESFDLDDDGFEIVEDVAGPSNSQKRRLVESSDGSESDIVEVGKNVKGKGKGKGKAVAKPPLKKAKTKSKSTVRMQREDLADNISTESESDGESALRSVTTITRGRRPGPESDTLKHFKPAILVTEPGKKGKRWSFRCRYCTATRSLQASGNAERFEDKKPRPTITNLTSHLKQHSEKLASAAADTPDTVERPPRELSGSSASAKLLNAYLQEGRLNPALEPTYKGFLQHFTAWIIEDDLPFTTGESSGLQRVFSYLKIQYKLPTNTTVRKVLDQITEELRGNVIKELTAINSKISYSHDVWTNRQMIFSFAGIMAHWIDDDWKLVERLVDFKHLDSKEHVGQYAAKAFVKSASGRGGLNKITMTMDNASSCDTMSDALGLLLQEKYRIQYHSGNNRIRCLAHVVNLVVQAILKAVDEADPSDEEDYYLLNKDAPFHYEESEDDELQAMEEEENVDVDEENQDSDGSELPEDVRTLSPVKRLRLIVTKIVSSPQRRTLFRRCATRKYSNGQTNEKGTPLSELMVIRDVATRWNYTHAMMKRGRLLQEAIDNWVFLHAEFRDLALSKSDWKKLEHLENILQASCSLLVQMSRNDTPTIPWVFANVPKDGSFREAATAGLTKLKTYHDYAKGNSFYVVATACHPAMRLQWFGPPGSDEYNRASVIFKHVYDEYLRSAPPTPSGVTSPSKANNRNLSSNMSFLESLLSVASTGEQDGADIPAASEYDRYTGGEGGSGDVAMPLHWWKVCSHFLQ